jgi:hypothetical protein
MGTKQEKPIDISRESIIRLLKRGRKARADAIEGSYASGWWDGHNRCCELLLDMEHE